MNDVIGGAQRVLKASKTALVDSAKTISNHVVDRYGKGWINRAQLIGIGAGAAYGAGTADYRYGPGDAVTRGLAFGAMGGLAGTGHRLFKRGAFNAASRSHLSTNFSGIGDNFMLNSHAWTDRDRAARDMWRSREAARATAPTGASTRKGSFINAGSIFG